MEAVIFGVSRFRGHLEDRTRRSLRAAGLKVISVVSTESQLSRRLASTSAGVLLIRAGGWLRSDRALTSFSPSATDKPLLGFGALLAAVDDPNDARASQWAGMLRNSGGDLAMLRSLTLPFPCFFYLESPAAAHLAGMLARGEGFSFSLRQMIRSGNCRAIHLPALDGYFDSQLRVVQVVTTIQIGGAERVTLDLAAELQRQGVPTCVAAFGQPTRLAFSEPANFADLSGVPADVNSRADAVAKLARDFGADIVHAHLIRAAEAKAIRDRGLPLVVTIHNMPQSWPAGLAESGSDVADLFLACSNAVARAARERLPGIPIRTVWNGIQPGSFSPTGNRIAAGARLRQEIGILPEDFVIAAVANPRRQKRLEMLPDILCRLQEIFGPERRARLILAGAPAAGNRDAEEALLALHGAIEKWGNATWIHWTGPVLNIAPVLAASDVLISVSAFEGLSLAHLEALAAGIPVVATDVGGASEIAGRHSRLTLVSADARPEELAFELGGIARVPIERTSSLAKGFTCEEMARRYRSFYPQAIGRNRHSRHPIRDEGLWLITNNFSTGGAQSSARRLLLGLAAQGHPVSAIVVQEDMDQPTPGRSALDAAGIPVIVVAPATNRDAAEAVTEILAYIAGAPVRPVVFWNLITSYKMLLADSLLLAPVYDVSPGEMYFESMTDYFERPRPSLPILAPEEYGQLLDGVVVKYGAEALKMERMLGAKVHVIPNGIDIPRQGRSGKKNGKLILGTAARISSRKKLEHLINAFRLALPQLPPCVLQIAGGVEVGQKMYARSLVAAACGLPVEWLGEVADMHRFLNGLDLFLMISEPAGCPNASLEAMAAGLPVIATDVGGASEQVIDGRTGILVPGSNVPAFVAALIELAHCEERRLQLGRNAREHVRKHFSMEQMVAKYKRLFGLDDASPPETTSSSVFLPPPSRETIPRVL